MKGHRKDCQGCAYTAGDIRKALLSITSLAQRVATWPGESGENTQRCGSQIEIARVVPMWLRFLVPCVLIISMGTARAQYLPPPNAAENPIIIEPQHIAVSSSFDADSIGNRSAYVDGTLAPFSGIYESGARFRLTGDAGQYQFITSEDPRTLGTGHYVEGGLLAGYGIRMPRFSITGLVGPAFGQFVNQGVTTDRWGAKAVIEMYARPTDLTMASGSIAYSTIGNNLQVQAKAGLKIFGDVYFGPDTKFTWQQILPWQIILFHDATD